MTEDKYDPSEFIRILQDPAQLQHVGLLYWINTAVKQIGYGPVISLMCSYMANIVSKTLDTAQAKEEALVLITQAIRNNVSMEDTESTSPEEDLTNLLKDLKKNTDTDIN